jgi:predicted nucleotidyltransferase
MKVRIYNETLNPALWDLTTNTLKQEIRNTLLKIAYDFYKDVELSAPIEDVYLLGSGANYNWTETSDVDLHVLINFKKINPDVDLDKKLVDSIKSNWNKNHNITIKNHKVELYIQDITEKNRAMGVYSVLKNHWIKAPDKLNIQLDNALIQQKYSAAVLQIKDAIDSKDIEKIKAVSKSIYDMREVGLSKIGEFSVENIVFKLLRNKNYIDLIKNTTRSLYDASVSIKQ